MKKFRVAYILLFVLTITNNCLADESSIILFTHEVNGGGKTNVWRVPIDVLNGAPSWKMGDKEPPLSMGEAIKVAKKWLVSKGASTNLCVVELIVRPVYAIGGPYQNVCYYNILFGNVGIYGHFRRCILLMDGKIIEPHWLGPAPELQLNYSSYDE